MKRLFGFILALSLLLMTSCQNNEAENSAKSSESQNSSAFETEESSSLSVSSQSEEISQTQEESEPSSEETSQIKASQNKNTSSPSTLSNVKEETTAWWYEGLKLDRFIKPSSSCNDPIPKLYAYSDSERLSYNNFGNLFSENEDDYFDMSLILKSAAEAEDIGNRIKSDNFLELFDLEDNKYRISFYEKGLHLKYSPKGGDFSKEVKLSLNKDDYDTILNRFDKLLEQSRGYKNASPSWLSMMKSSRIESISFTSKDQSASKSYNVSNDIMNSISLPVHNAREVDSRSLENAAVLNIKFNNGLVYNIYNDGNQLLIHASDIDRAILYDIQNKGSNIYEELANGRVNPTTGKPVIYLYPQKETDCVVRVDYPRFSYTYPTYENGWFVKAYPDGRLINKKDGSEHYYLFWEGNEKRSWTYDEGFCVKGEDTEKFLREKLKELGLNPREYNDFITYWVPRMMMNPYNVITFAQEEYEELAPLTVEPKPDSILRVHMVYKPSDSFVEIKEQKLSGFERNGFTVVEWGGTEDRQ